MSETKNTETVIKQKQDNIIKGNREKKKQNLNTARMHIIKVTILTYCLAKAKQQLIECETCNC